jgi:hypothetical protein
MAITVGVGEWGSCCCGLRGMKEISSVLGMG